MWLLGESSVCVYLDKVNSIPLFIFEKFSLNKYFFLIHFYTLDIQMETFLTIIFWKKELKRGIEFILSEFA